MNNTAKKPSEKFFVHEMGLCDSQDIGEGTRVWAFAHVMAGAKIGKKCNIGEHAFVENKVVIGSQVVARLKTASRCGTS